MDIGDPIKTTVEEIRKVLNIENVVGETIETEDKILIPITRMGMGFGAGKAEGNGPDKSGGAGAGAGGAAGIEPIAMVVVFKGVDGPEGVKVMSLKNPDPLSRAIGEISNAAVEIMGQGSKMMKEKGHKKKEVKYEGKNKEAKFKDTKDETSLDVKDK
ncbi:GerW family sporulation protein [Methanobacterium spitsbergense]|uniref:Sporulation protein n=1 Tax=Methanobacterium spitsbergense TaxID=2874285 RepID=A0A8T5UV78_9EURY|nr:spore germination protein GerW family protein [Methanobacterium spitsbergense]MBZ2165826.1 sporulation protein [Methanobacterium spitsbergense]